MDEVTLIVAVGEICILVLLVLIFFKISRIHDQFEYFLEQEDMNWKRVTEHEGEKER